MRIADKASLQGLVSLACAVVGAAVLSERAFDFDAHASLLPAVLEQIIHADHAFQLKYSIKSDLNISKLQVSAKWAPRLSRTTVDTNLAVA